MSQLVIGVILIAIAAIVGFYGTQLAREGWTKCFSPPSTEITPQPASEQTAVTSLSAASARGLTVERIVGEINSAPPYQKEAVANNFKGIYVEWKGAIWDIEPPLFSKPGDTNVVVKVHPGESLHQILFTVSVDKYPQFKILKRGDQVGVSGKIKNCSGPGLYVELDVSEITFPK